MKTGWLTSESHMTLGMILVAVLIVTGKVGVSDGEGLARTLDDAVAKVCGAAMAIVPVVNYFRGRLKLKQQQLDTAPPDPAMIQDLVERFVRRAVRPSGPRLKPETQPDPTDEPPRPA